jgi:murein hydrolase activator
MANKSSYQLLGFSSLLLWLLMPAIAFPQNEKAKLQEKKVKIEEEINYTNQLLDHTKNTKATNLHQLNLINKKIGRREELINTISSQVTGMDGQIWQINRNISRLQDDLKKLKAEYASLIMSTYKNRDASSRLMFLFSSASFNQAYKRILYLKEYSNYRRAQAAEITRTQQKLNQQLTELEASKKSKESLLSQKEQEKNLLTQEKLVKDKTVKELTKQEKNLSKKLKENEAALAKLQSAIRSLITEEIRKANEARIRKAAEDKRLADARRILEEKKSAENAKKNEKPNTKEVTAPANKEIQAAKPEKVPELPVTREVVTSTNSMSSNNEDIKLSDNFAANRGHLPWPVERGIITESFGEHAHPDFKYIRTKNNGIDISSSPGAHARAVFEGEVSSVVFISGINYVVMIRHGDYLSVYSNLQSVNVKKGDKVKTKQILGTLVTDEEDGKTRIHFEVWHGTVLMNPETWISN